MDIHFPRTRALFVCAVLLLFAGGTVWGQGGTGELTGIVADPNGAVISKATITLRNEATGLTRTTETTNAGTFHFLALPITGQYTLTVEAPNFRKYQATGIIVSVGTKLDHPVTMQVGAVTESVTVVGGAPLVQTTESQVSTVVENKMWGWLPLEVRNQNGFINLIPGSVPDAFGGTTRGAAVNGVRPGTGNFLVEGYDNNDQGQGGRGATFDGGAITSISPDAIQEYRIITTAYAAEYGKGGGFVTDTVLKSGTNAWHGSLFWYNRIQALAANSFFSNRTPDPLDPTKTLEDRLVRNQFGGGVGGPIVKDKTFFYASYEGHLLREKEPRTTTGTTQQFLDFVSSGAFAAFHESDPNGLCMVNNAAACPGAFANSATTGTIFNSLVAVQPFPLAADPSTFQFTGGGLFTDGIVYPVPIFGQVTALNATKFNENRFTVKVDHDLTSNDKLHTLFLFEDSDSEDSIDGGDGTIGSPILSLGRSINTGVTWDHSFSPTILNTARVSFLRHTRDFPAVAGLEGVPSVVTQFDPLGVSLGQTSNLPQFFTDNQFQFQNHLSVVKGRHTFKGGAEYRRTRNQSSFEALKNGIFLPWGVEEMVTDGFFGDEADAALGTSFGAWIAQAAIDPSRPGNSPVFRRGYRGNEFAAYFQDDWRIRPNLTLNLGVRWEYQGPPHSVERLDSNFFFGNNIVPITSVVTDNPFFPFNSELTAKVVTGSFQVRDKGGIWQKDTNNFGPRAGFAWDIGGRQKWVLRGGGGVFFDRMWNNLFENIRFNAPFHSFATLGSFLSPVPIGPIITPGLYQVPFTNVAPFSGFGGLPSPRHMDQDLELAYTQQYYLGLQWSIGSGYVLEINGNSTLGRKLLGVIDINTYNGRLACDGTSTTAAACAAAVAAGAIPSAAFSTARPNTGMAGDNFRTNAFKSSYFGGTVLLRKSYSSGVFFNTHYTWGHAIDELSDAFNNGRGAILRPTNNFNIQLDRGNADFDIRHRFVFSGGYELPWMKDHILFGGWSINGGVTLQSGVPIQLRDSRRAGDLNQDGYNTDRLVFLGSGNINNAVTGDSPADGYFDPTQFARHTCPVTENFGLWCDSPLGRNQLFGPGYYNVNLSIAKRFKITEQLSARLVGNAFNLFNRPHFVTVVGNLADTTNFGKSTSTLDPRILQLAVRLDW